METVNHPRFPLRLAGAGSGVSSRCVPAVRRAASLIGFVLISGALAAGCGYFKPAQPETPEPGSAIIPNYGQPDNTLETIAKAIADKGRSNGQSAYTGAFADTALDGREFHAFFDAQTLNYLAQFGITPPADWTHKDEHDFYARFVTLTSVPQGSDYLFVWTKDPSPGGDDIQSDRATLYREYHAYAILQDNVTLTFARGFATLYLVRASSKWLIVRWEDHQASDANLSAGEECMGQRRLEQP
jgi:hypothetical protein